MLNRHNKITIVVALAATLLFGAFQYLRHRTFDVLSPAGPVAAQEKHLMIVAVLLMLIVVVPVFVLLAVISWRYREGGNKKAKYTPDWDRHKGFETIWWGLPTMIIIILSIITWNSSHRLDPSRALVSSTPSITIQVVAMQWKWLFIYPQQQIASVNYLQLPVNTPVNFEITSNSTMNSFWIPQLGGQIYAMAGMSTQLHLMADKAGSYRGSSANVSGIGFAGMHFQAQATSRDQFDAWVAAGQHSNTMLDQAKYGVLAIPDKQAHAADQAQQQVYFLADSNLYNQIVSVSGGDDMMQGMNHGATY